MAPITIIPKACSCCKGERSSRDKSSNLPLPNILYEGSEGSKGSEGGGGGYAANLKKGRGSAAGCVEGLWFASLRGDSACEGTITCAYCRAIYEESVSWCFILPPA